jgi:hypothetical protein
MTPLPVGFGDVNGNPAIAFAAAQGAHSVNNGWRTALCGSRKA